MAINVSGFLDSLKFMAYGMLGIVVVMLVIYAIVALMMKPLSKKKKAE